MGAKRATVLGVQRAGRTSSSPSHLPRGLRPHLISPIGPGRGIFYGLCTLTCVPVGSDAFHSDDIC